MTKLVSDFLNVSKIEAGRFDLRQEEFLLSSLLEETAADTELVSPGYTITVNKPDQPVVIYADKEKITQVLTNFLNNAVKYSPENKHISITLENTGGEVKVAIIDRGIGVRSDEQEKIFQRFYRSGSYNSHVSGFGIGLYISAEIIKSHGGTIGVLSRDGEGSCFYFKLPAIK